MSEVDYYYNPYSILFLVFWCFWTLFFAFNIYLYLKHQDSLFIQKRYFPLLLSSAIGQYGTMTIQSFRIILGDDHILNLFELYHTWLFNPLHILPYPLRSLRFILDYNIQAYKKSDKPTCSNKFWAWMVKKKKYIDNKYFFWFLMIVCGLLFLWAIGLNVKQDRYHTGVTIADSPDTELYFWVSFGLSLAFSIIMWIAIYFMREIIDIFQIKREYFLMSIVWFIFINGYCIIGLDKIGPPQFGPIVAIIECILSFLVTFSLPIQLAIVKPIEDPNAHITFETFLDDTENNGPELVEKFALSALCEQNFYFLRDVRQYRTIEDEEERIKMFKEMRDKYILSSVDDPLHINVSDLLKKEIYKITDDKIEVNTFKPYYDEISKIFGGSQFIEFKKRKDVQTFIQKYRAKYTA